MDAQPRASRRRGACRRHWRRGRGSEALRPRWGRALRGGAGGDTRGPRAAGCSGRPPQRPHGGSARRPMPGAPPRAEQQPRRAGAARRPPGCRAAAAKAGRARGLAPFHPSGTTALEAFPRPEGQLERSSGRGAKWLWAKTSASRESAIGRGEWGAFSQAAGAARRAPGAPRGQTGRLAAARRGRAAAPRRPPGSSVARRARLQRRAATVRAPGRPLHDGGRPARRSAGPRRALAGRGTALLHSSNRPRPGTAAVQAWRPARQRGAPPPRPPRRRAAAAASGCSGQPAAVQRQCSRSAPVQRSCSAASLASPARRRP
jgi:hypothetical protein